MYKVPPLSLGSSGFDLGFFREHCRIRMSTDAFARFYAAVKADIETTLQGDGGLYCGLHVDNGGIGGRMKTTLREIIEKYDLNVRITPNQNLILCDIRKAWTRPITTALAQAGLLVRLIV